ncbi:uncharacterized protein LOC124326928 [Daphnia pulicaria]|uniref:uncharacterized protein LOC124326928 n=1 Tax=Daphnia pulicaria TaxID=35523 RepID=UPI001EEC080D|nr:uncharacterized protein LOC124326928 [Daphnia pulicaria]
MASVRFPNSQEICRNCNHPIAGRLPQMLVCNSCLFYVHRTCLPGKGISSTEYVRLKKQKEAFHFKFNPCSNVEEFVHLGIGNGRDINQPVASSSSVADDVDQLPASTSRGRGRPRAVLADVSDQLPASTSRGRGRPRAVLANDVDQPPVSLSRGRGRPRAVLADDVDQPPASLSRGRGCPRAVLADDVDQPPASLSLGRGRPRAVLADDVDQPPLH